MQLSRRRLMTCGMALTTLGTMSACQLPGSGPPPRKFRLTPASVFDERIQPASWSLGVDPPKADRSIDTTRIVRLTNGIELEHFANANWASRPTSMIHTLILRSFRHADMIDIVVDDRSDVRADFVLRTDLREFQAELAKAAPMKVRVALGANLVRMPKREVVGSEDFDHVAAASGSIESVVTTFDEALGLILKELIEWTLITGNAAVN